MSEQALLWRPGRTKVYTRGQDNPWSHTGSIARDHRSFLAALGGADRQEEDEDFEVLAPRRPTRSWIPVTSDQGDWFDAEVFAGLEATGPEQDPDRRSQVRSAFKQSQTIAYQAKQARSKARAELKKQPWRITLERGSNYRILDALDDHLERASGGHVYCYRYRYYRLNLTDTNGFTRSITIKQSVFIIEHGDITKETQMVKTCNATGCLAPDHHDVQ